MVRLSPQPLGALGAVAPELRRQRLGDIEKIFADQLALIAPKVDLMILAALMGPLAGRRLQGSSQGEEIT